jgi:hypothetical protein
MKQTMTKSIPESNCGKKRAIKELRCNKELIRGDIHTSLRFWSPGLGIGHSSSVIGRRSASPMHLSYMREGNDYEG